MKKILTLSISLLLLVGCASMEQQYQEATNKIETPIFNSAVDKFTGQKKISWAKHYRSSFDLYQNGEFGKTVSVTIDPKTKEWVSSIILSKDSKEHRYLRCKTTNWLVDGKIIKPKAVLFDSKINRNPVHVSEMLIVGFSKEDFATLAKANKIEYRVCNDEYEMTAEEKEGIRTVYQEAINN